MDTVFICCTCCYSANRSIRRIVELPAAPVKATFAAGHGKANPQIMMKRIAGTLAYMAPEQTGRMNRSIDSRSDLYAFGVTLYEILTGSLPFTAVDPMEWVHCHIAKRPVPPASGRSTCLPLLCQRGIIHKDISGIASES
jgi:serine/threonine protein kinase